MLIKLIGIIWILSASNKLIRGILIGCDGGKKTLTCINYMHIIGKIDVMFLSCTLLIFKIL